MPKLNIYQQQYQQSSRMSDASSFGSLEGEATKRLGNAVSGLGEVLFKKNEADQLEKARKDVSEETIQLYKDIEELRRAAPEDGAGHTDSVERLIEEKWNKIGENYSGKASKYIEQAKLSLIGSVVPREIGYESSVRGQHRADEESRLQSETLNAITANPDPNITSHLIGDMIQRVNGYTYSKDNPTGIPEHKVQELIKNNKYEIYNTFIEAQIDKVDKLDDALSLKEDLGSEVWQENLASSDYSKAKDKIEIKIKQLEKDIEVKNQVAKAEIIKGISDYQAYVLDGNYPNRPAGLSDEEIKSVFGDKADEILQDVHRAERRSVELGIIANGSAEQAASVLKRAISSLGVDDYKDNRATVKLLKSAYKSRINALGSQGADYVMKHDRSLQKDASDLSQLEQTNPYIAANTKPSFYKKRIQSQLNMGVDPYNVKVLSSDEIGFYKKMFNNVFTQQGEDIGEAISRLKNETGDLFNLAIRDLYDAKAVPKGLSVIADIEDSTEQSKMAEGLRDFRQLSDGLSKSDYDTSDLLQPLFETMPTSVYQNSGQTITEMVDAANALAVVNIRTNVNDPVNSAVEQIVGKYNIYNKIRIPKSITGDLPEWKIDNAYENMINRFDDDFGDSVGWDRIGTQYGLSEDQIRNDVITSLKAGKMNIYTTPEDDGLVITSNNGAYLPDKEGNPLVIPFDKFIEYTESRDVIDDNKSLGAL